ncbi:MAG: NUDIX hydrolase [Candidatus Aenigmatarchaeota archaeon]
MVRKAKIPRLAVDAVILTKDKKVLLVKRKFKPFKDFYALPGGFVEYGEKVEDACVREAFEETGLKVKIVRLLGVYSDPKRDPRFHNVSIAFICKRVGGSLKDSKETYDVRFFSNSELKKIKLAFDHKKILNDAGII